MRNLRRFFSATATLALCLAGCRSPDTVAANKAAEAQADLDQGRIAQASIAIRKALAARDDVADYWLLKAHIDMGTDNRQGAFADYEYVLQLDHGNMEALQALCQLGLSAGPPGKVDSYADQLLVVAPDAAPGLVAKGSVALVNGDPAKAEEFADRVLARDPQNMPALSLRAHVMLAQDKFADAAALIEKTPDGSNRSIAKLSLLEEIYTLGHDRPAYVRTVERLAAAAPGDADVQLSHADVLYQDGQIDAARGVIQRVMAANPRNYHVAAGALDTWLNAGPQALDAGRMVADAAPLSLLMKADYAQFANETGHPDVALAILHGADQGDPAPDNSNAKAAFAYALGITGRRPAALAQLNAILDEAHDPNQPWALLARARLLAAAHDFVNAIRDARLLVANDRENATAYLALADILRASGSADLGISALREGLRASSTSTRLAARLAAALAAQGQTVQAAQVARDQARSAPMDKRAQQLSQSYGATSPGMMVT